MSNGLADIVAAETVLSDVDGLAGRLVIRGHALAELARSWSYERTAHLMFEGFFADLPDIEIFAARLGAARVAAFGRFDPTLAGLPLFDALRALMARLPDGDSLDDALELVAAPAVFIPALLRARSGETPLQPDARRAHAEDMLAMLSGAPADPALARALETYLVTIVDHGLNASTFAARVVASTEAGLGSSVLAAMSALKGPLHGGAPGPVLDMLDAVGTAGNAAPWVAAELAAGRRLMGFGHRIYRVRDPRADALNAALAPLATARGSNGDRLTLARAVETEALAALSRHKPDRPLATNVEFYTALLLEAVGLPRDAFTATFAAGRVTGWIAHAREQRLKGKLIRPKSLYVGPIPLQAA